MTKTELIKGLEELIEESDTWSRKYMEYAQECEEHSKEYDDFMSSACAFTAKAYAFRSVIPMIKAISAE